LPPSEDHGDQANLDKSRPTARVRSRMTLRDAGGRPASGPTFKPQRRSQDLAQGTVAQVAEGWVLVAGLTALFLVVLGIILGEEPLLGNGLIAAG